MRVLVKFGASASTECSAAGPAPSTPDTEGGESSSLGQCARMSPEVLDGSTELRRWSVSFVTAALGEHGVRPEVVVEADVAPELGIRVRPQHQRDRGTTVDEMRMHAHLQHP